jgi:DeoR/GlpR family transcriptional regulator of sugar metabolism
MAADEVDSYLLGEDGVDFLHESLKWVVQQLMEAKVSELIGAEHGERTPDRASHRMPRRCRQGARLNMFVPVHIRTQVAENDHHQTDGRQLIPEERRRLIAERVRRAGSVNVAALEREFGISAMTVRRDLSALEREGRVRRTYGGAVRPSLAGHEDSFFQRMEQSEHAKRRLAKRAVALLQSGQSVFIDCSTTAFYAARQMIEDRVAVTILTNSLPVMELFGSVEAPGAELVGIGGSLRTLSLSFVGQHAIATIDGYFADKAFVSVKGVTPDGHLTAPDPGEAEVKRTMIERAREPVLLIDGSKFEGWGLSVVTSVARLGRVLVADAREADLEPFLDAGVAVETV